VPRFRSAVEDHYAPGQLLDAILAALRDSGRDPEHLTPTDLAPVDEFHIRGRHATVELAKRANLTPGLHVLDVGCGLGGSARYLASEMQCRVTGVDITQEYVDVANQLAALVGLGDRIEFRRSSALELPFVDGAFDVAWTEHVQMNIEDKRAFYREIARVLAPGGRLLFHDVFLAGDGPVHYPVPWAEDSSISFLATPEAVRTLLEEMGFSAIDWEDKSRVSLDWFVAAAEKTKVSGPPRLGLHLLMGSTARAKLENTIRNLRERRVAVIQAVMQKA
jgi:SAM-dependent methyltransferase